MRFAKETLGWIVSVNGCRNAIYLLKRYPALNAINFSGESCTTVVSLV